MGQRVTSSGKSDSQQESYRAGPVVTFVVVVITEHGAGFRTRGERSIDQASRSSQIFHCPSQLLDRPRVSPVPVVVMMLQRCPYLSLSLWNILLLLLSMLARSAQPTAVYSLSHTYYAKATH